MRVSYRLVFRDLVYAWTRTNPACVQEGTLGVQVDKGVRGMPRLSEAKKDVASCDKLRGPAHTV